MYKPLRVKTRIGLAVTFLLPGAGAFAQPTHQIGANTSHFSGDSKHDQMPSRVPAPPRGVGYTDSAPVVDASIALPFVDYVYTNQRGEACYATLETNAGVRVLAGFLAIWQPSTLLVDAGVSAPADGTCPAVPTSTWSGIPGDATDGKVLNAAIHDANIQYVIEATANRTSDQELAAYLDDRRGKAYSVSDGMGPLTSIWRTLTEQFTTITDIPADATTVKYDDQGNNVGVGSTANFHNFGTVVDLVANIGENGSTEPTKRFYKYARPWRWSSDVKVVPALVPAESATPTTDGGFVSGHEAEAMRDAVAMGYAVPERFQEMLMRAAELGHDRILAGMHSPLDVMGGRMLGLAVASASLATGIDSTIREEAYTQAQNTLMAAVGVSSLADLNAFAHSQGSDSDRFADHDSDKALYLRYMTYGFPQIGDTKQPAVVPKDAEVVLETRLPYLNAEQRRVVLKTTAIPSGYPVLDDAEGWGRLNLFDAADGYGAFNGDVEVTMDASLGGFNAADSWRNNISGAGKLTKLGSGALSLTGDNSYRGGTEIEAGILKAMSATAFGTGDLYVGGGTVVSGAPSMLKIFGQYTQLNDGTLELVIGHDGAGRLAVKKDVTLRGGVLHIAFMSDSVPRPGAVINVIQTQEQMKGRFASIVVDGASATPIYTRNGLWLRVNKK